LKGSCALPKFFTQL
jgi:hypothetical protein